MWISTLLLPCTTCRPYHLSFLISASTPLSPAFRSRWPTTSPFCSSNALFFELSSNSSLFPPPHIFSLLDISCLSNDLVICATTWSTDFPRPYVPPAFFSCSHPHCQTCLYIFNAIIHTGTYQRPSCYRFFHLLHYWRHLWLLFTFLFFSVHWPKWALLGWPVRRETPRH